METILIIDDDPAIGDLEQEVLQRAGYAVRRAYSGTEARLLLRELRPDLILLDLMLPGLSGEALLPELAGIPTIVVSAKTAVQDRVGLLLGGAVDYLTKPFDTQELLARVKANIRRMSMVPAGKGAAASTNRMELGRVTVDTDQMAVLKDGQPLQLSQREYDLIRFLAAQPGKVFSREALMEHVWDYEGYVGDVRAVDVAVRRLREKIEDDPASPKFVVTKRGMGYYFGG